MDSTGEQLHPNWRALATLHIPLKRFIAEGTNEVATGKIQAKSDASYQINGINGTEAKEFYEVTIANKNLEIKTNKQTANSLKFEQQQPKKTTQKQQPFVSGNFFRFATENKFNELKNLKYQANDINTCDNYGWSALMMAACAGATEAVKVLLNLGANTQIKDKANNSALDLAKKHNHAIIVDLLMNYKPKVIANATELSVSEVLVAAAAAKKPKPLLPFYCEICKLQLTETTQSAHQTSTIHQFNVKSTLPENKLQKFNISARNRGLQLMTKQGWDKESGLGPTNSGRLYPIKTVIRKQRTGLGIEQPPARVTHYEAFDLRATKRNGCDYYKKKPRNRNDIKREKVREWKRDRRLRNALS